MNKVLSLKESYDALVKEKYILTFKNPHLVPKIEKVTVNLGISKLLKLKGNKALDHIVQDLYNITGQTAIIKRAKKSCDGFSIKQNDVTHLKITLRKKNMYTFLTKLVFFDMPRSKDFRGFNPNSFDRQGNYCIGIKDCTVFHGISKKDIFVNFGFNIIITTNANMENTKLLLEDLNFVFCEQLL